MAGEFLIHDTGRRIAAQLAKRPGVRVQIYTSAFDRTIKTAEILATELKAFHAKVITVPELAPQSLGGLEGQVSSTSKSFIDQLRTTALSTIPPRNFTPLTSQNGESTKPATRNVCYRRLRNSDEGNLRQPEPCRYRV